MKAIYPVLGFRQGHDEEVGMEELHFKHLRKLANPELTVYHPREWTEDAGNILAQFQRNGIDELLLIAYSHGQALACEISRLAPRYNIKTIRMVLCDPVFRSRILPRSNWFQIFSVRSIFTTPKIKIPATVHRVDWVRQFLDKPQAHELIAEDPKKTLIAPPIVLAHRHTRIQWADRWFDLVIDVALEFANAPPKAIPVPEP
jgi:hypothetical protein